MLIYLDESGYLGFDFTQKKIVVVMCVLICDDPQVNLAIVRGVKITLENKLSYNVHELKGSHAILSIKQYFLKQQLKPFNNCRLYAAIANKITWLKHHKSNYNSEPQKSILYDEVASRLFTQVDFPNPTSNIQIVVDRSKNKKEIGSFDERIRSALMEKISANTII